MYLKLTSLYREVQLHSFGELRSCLGSLNKTVALCLRCWHKKEEVRNEKEGKKIQSNFVLYWQSLIISLI